ncbi:hypothetical protein TNIN_322611 [Trichonephila inaurata madagascariensis]|uniref:Uncharacterized protein n=1 Tax=Trichonephila inaurata madagascariensis TaxID=2747483 RepID=A0A8X6Y4G5_9ARAC|nr:hypothetical protein TNIN_322611 [Trichonephila inaurata madagascariensis]
MSSDSGPDPRTKNFTSKEFYHVTSKEVPRNDRLGELFEVKKLTPLSQVSFKHINQIRRDEALCFLGYQSTLWIWDA